VADGDPIHGEFMDNVRAPQCPAGFVMERGQTFDLYPFYVMFSCLGEQLGVLVPDYPCRVVIKMVMGHQYDVRVGYGRLDTDGFPVVWIHYHRIPPIKELKTRMSVPSDMHTSAIRLRVENIYPFREAASATPFLTEPYYIYEPIKL
jgi:hypothetical protein